MSEANLPNDVDSVILSESDISDKLMYLSSPQIRAYLLHPNIYVGKQSRGTGKSTRIQAMRSIRIAKDVPQSVNVFYGASYIGLQLRTLPGTISGWNHFGWQEGENNEYVINREPPKNWLRPHDFVPLTYKNTISTKYGSIFILGSNDRPGLVNSLSITGGVFVDEFRFIDLERMQQDLNAAIRGNTAYWKNNPHLFSMTITTDQPFPDEDAYTYLEEFRSKMNIEQIYLIAQASLKVEQVKTKIFEQKKELNTVYTFHEKAEVIHKISTLENTLAKKQMYLDKIRQNSVYFDEAGALSNIHILGKEYLNRNADSRFTSKLIFRTSFLDIKPEEVENKFYTHFSKRHVITGDFSKTYQHFDEYGIDPAFQLDSSYIKDCDPNKELEVEIDFGDMCSASVSQTFGREERYIATFEVVLPLDITDLVDLICKFFQYHRNKKVNVYKDPSGNYNKNKKQQTYGPQTILRFQQNKWQAMDCVPEGSMNPSHDAKHQLLSSILKENIPSYPIVRIIKETNQNLISSIKRAPMLVVIRKDGVKEIIKDKRSEKTIKLQDKPGLTTDHSDHFDIKLWHKYHHLLPSSNLFQPFFPINS
jgi:hypothetical protein